MFALAPEFPAKHPDLPTLSQHINKFTGAQARGSPATGHYKHTGQEKYRGGIVKL
jgi:hypothetical protein